MAQRKFSIIYIGGTSASDMIQPQHHENHQSLPDEHYEHHQSLPDVKINWPGDETLATGDFEERTNPLAKHTGKHTVRSNLDPKIKTTRPKDTSTYILMCRTTFNTLPLHFHSHRYQVDQVLSTPSNRTSPKPSHFHPDAKYSQHYASPQNPSESSWPSCSSLGAFNTFVLFSHQT